MQPLDNNYDDGSFSNDYDGKSITLNMNHEDALGNKKITIPLDKYKDKDHINLDINLRLVDFMQNQGNRSMDNFDQPEDPLARYIRRYETNISRSLPGSSGSLNKLKPLPPVGGGGGGTRRHPPASVQPYSHGREPRLQHEYDNEIKSEGTYLSLFIND